MNINKAVLEANIAGRADRITEEYRLAYDGTQDRWYVYHSGDYNRQYTVTATSCSCPCFEHHNICKHHLGLEKLAEREIQRYTLIGLPKKLALVEAFLGAVRFAPHEAEYEAWKLLNNEE